MASSPEEKAKRAAYMRDWLKKNADRVNAQRRSRNAKRREIIRAQKRASYLRTKESVLEYQKKYRSENKEYICQREKARRMQAAEELRAKKRAEYIKNKERYLASNAEWRAKNPDWQKKWTEKNREIIRVKSRERARRLRKESPHYAAVTSLRSRLWGLLKKQGAKKLSPSGLTAESLKSHLEAKFLAGMTWENYGSGWHIDHIIPCSAFDLTNPEHVKFCFSLSNLQPLLAKDNIRKSDKIPEGTVIPFDLKIA